MTRAETEAEVEALELEAEAYERLAKAKRVRAAAALAGVDEQPAAAVSRINLQAASARFALSPRQLRAAIKAGKLPGERVGREYLVKPDDVLNLIEINSVQPRMERSSNQAASRTRAVGEPTSDDVAQARANVNRQIQAGRLQVLKRG